MRAWLLCVCVAVALSAPTKKPRPDYVVVVTDANSKDKVLSATSSAALNEQYGTTGNPVNVSYPLIPEGKYYIQNSTYFVAPPPVVDPKLKDAAGINPDPVAFGFPLPQPHPMETQTPLGDRPCEDFPVISVKILSAEQEPGYAYPVLPPRYGCSGEFEGSREKASPAIEWTGYPACQVDEFSLQMVSMGDEVCTGRGAEGFNRIHWHVTGIKNHDQGTITLNEGASKDKRTLYGGREQPNQWLEEYYGGPCPVPGTTECFRLKVIAHLKDGKSCLCGFEDFLFHRPLAPEKEVPVIYESPVFAPIGKKQ